MIATSNGNWTRARLSAVAGVSFLGLATAAAGTDVTLVLAQGAAVSETQMTEGETLYLKNCRLCHGSKGTSGKPLKANENLADGEYVAGVILVGPGYMTAFAEHLSDEEIALITTYVRNSWGNAYGPISSEDVAPLR